MLPASFVGQSQLLVKFVATSNNSNNFYLDNVNVGSNVVSVKEEIAGVTSAHLFPNPTSDRATLSLMSPGDMGLNLTIINAIGQVMSQRTISVIAGANTISLETQGFAEGMYHVVLSSAEGTITRKLTVIK
jgi:hypothetical protein